MRVCLLTDEKIEDFNPAGHLKNYDWDYVTVTPPITEFIHEVSRSRQYDVYLNIYEGHDENENSGLRFVEALEKLNLSFTGAESKFYRCTREEMQAAAEADQIRFARGFHAVSYNDLKQADGLAYPLIVKHPNSFASMGLTKESRVTNFAELQNQFERMSMEFGSARVEEFIEGRELSCLVVENADDPKSPFAYSPAEVQFPEGETFLHEAAKWYSWDVHVVPLRDEILAARIQEVSCKFFLAMEGNGYARIDLRVRPNGEIVIIEINPNCGILYYGPDDRSHADLPISWDAAGHDGFLDRIFRAAIKRQAMRTKG
jgi:D-alanine-D-alanine ligase